MTQLRDDFRDGEIIPLSIDHTTYNEDELLRLAHLGVDLRHGQEYPELGEHQYTRYRNYLALWKNRIKL